MAFVFKMEDAYADSTDMLDIMNALNEAPNLRAVELVVRKAYPDWIVGYFARYSDDYPYLTETWSNICVDAGVQRAQIMIVSNIFFDGNHTLIQKFSDIFTKAGFVVRRKSDLIPCNVCNAMLPVRSFYENLKTAGKTDIKEWSDTCVGCEQT